MNISNTILKAAKILSHRRELNKTKGGKDKITWARQVIANTTA